SYITGNTMYADAQPYSIPAEPLPTSATQGLAELDVQGRTLSNVPPLFSEYVDRTSLQHEIGGLLVDDRHPIITLNGPGGIGKTSLAIKAINSLARDSRFSLLVWL